MSEDIKNSPVCDVAKKCGACQLSNMDYSRQLKFKQAGAVKLLRRFCRVNQIIGMAYPYHYRNKVQAAVRRGANGRTVTGVYQSSTGGVVATDNCFINDKKANEIIAYLRGLLISLKIPPYNPKNGSGAVRHIMVRKGFATGEYMAVIVCVSDKLPNSDKLVQKLVDQYKEIKTVVLNVNKSPKMLLGANEKVLYGDGFIEDVLCGRRFRISPRSFYQVNPAQTEVLYSTAIDYAELTGEERVLDAYCGIGTIGLVAAKSAKEVVGVELNGEAVKDAKANSELNGADNIKFFKADSGEFMRNAAARGEHFDVVFADPPRAGCSREFLKSLVELKPDKAVYISCNPQTLARDLYFLIHNGYEVRRIQPIDMFPHTNHVECVCLLTQQKAE